MHSTRLSDIVMHTSCMRPCTARIASELRTLKLCAPRIRGPGQSGRGLIMSMDSKMSSTNMAQDTDAASESSSADNIKVEPPSQVQLLANATTTTSSVKPNRHKASLSWDSLGDLALAIPMSPWAAFKRVLSEGFLMFRLAYKLWTYLGVGYKWSTALLRLIIYATLLLPGFIQMIFFYFFSPRVLRSVPYGPGPRQRLDLYLPEQYSKTKTYPVAIFVTGGAWTIGYKAWGALLARRLSSAGVVVASLDYRNFPQGDALQMLEDVNTGIAWMCSKCSRYRGDPDNIVLIGQSAGGQLAMLAMLKQAEQEACNRSGSCKGVLGAYPTWSPKDVRAFVGVSGAYDLEGLQSHLHKRGLYKNMFLQIMSIDGVPRLDVFSPLSMARSWTTTPYSPRSPAAHMPDVVLLHGTTDNSVPCSSSEELHAALTGCGVNSTIKLVPGKSHTSFLLEGPMSGGRDDIMDLVLPIIASAEPQDDRAHMQNGGVPHEYPKLCPVVLCKLAGYICPF